MCNICNDYGQVYTRCIDNNGWELCKCGIEVVKPDAETEDKCDISYKIEILDNYEWETCPKCGNKPLVKCINYISPIKYDMIHIRCCDIENPGQLISSDICSSISGWHRVCQQYRDKMHIRW